MAWHRCDYKFCSKEAKKHVNLRFPGGTFETDISLCPEHECFKSLAVEAIYRHESVLRVLSQDLKKHGLVLPPKESVRAEMAPNVFGEAPLILVHDR